MSPCYPLAYRVNRAVGDTKLSRNGQTTYVWPQCAYLPNLLFGQLRQRMTVSAIVGAMRPFVDLIVGRRFPGQMFPSDAPKVSLAATMRGLMSRRWGWTVLGSTSSAMHVPILIVRTPHESIPAAALTVRPKQTGVLVMAKYNFGKIAKWLTFGQPARQWITVALKASIVPVAKPSALYFDGRVAAIDAANIHCF